MSIEEPRYPPISAISTGLAGRCPRCGDGRLFQGFLTVAPKCEVCGLDFGFADSGDGPAVFVTLIAGFLVVGLALIVDMTCEPPIWIFMVVFIPLALVVCLGMLRPLKGVLIALQYQERRGARTAGEAMSGRVRSLAAPAAATLIGLAVLVGLGVWQLKRLAWKEALIAAVEARALAPPVEIPSALEWAEAQSPRLRISSCPRFRRL